MMDVHIVATGARTPLGLHAAPSAAARRAGINAMRQHPFMIDRLGDPMPAALDATLDPRQVGPERLVALADTALREASRRLENVGPQSIQMPFFLALPELRPGFGPSDASRVGSALQRSHDRSFHLSELGLLTEGHAAGLKALAIAADQIQQGACDASLVGGVDSYFHPDTLEWLDENRQLLGADARSAFVPGEAAAFCLLMSERLRGQLGLPSLARVRASAVGQETALIKTSTQNIGAGLTMVVERAVAGLALPSEVIDAVICDLNGERYRGEEWGFVCLRLPQFFNDPLDYWAPADSWGDTGASSGPLFAMLACQAAARGYAKGPRTLLWASSENGLRAAVLLDTTGED